MGGGLVTFLRIAIGLKALYRGHDVEVVLSGNAVLCALKQSNPDWVDRYLRSASIHEIPIYIAGNALERLGIENEKLVHPMGFLNWEEYLKLWRSADLQISL